MAFKVLHKPTGLFWTGDQNNNLSDEGKVYKSSKNTILTFWARDLKMWPEIADNHTPGLVVVSLFSETYKKYWDKLATVPKPKSWMTPCYWVQKASIKDFELVEV